MKKKFLIPLILSHQGEFVVRIAANSDDLIYHVPVSKAALIRQFDKLGSEDYTGLQMSGHNTVRAQLIVDSDELYRDDNNQVLY